VPGGRRPEALLAALAEEEDEERGVGNKLDDDGDR